MNTIIFETTKRIVTIEFKGEKLLNDQAIILPMLGCCKSTKHDGTKEVKFILGWVKRMDVITIQYA